MFTIPDKYKASLVESSREGSKYKIVDGDVKARSSVTWFTNIPLKKYKEEIPLVCEYSPELYPKYDNYNAIEVSKTARIPMDYYGVMGVPITFLDKYNPEQFEIVGRADANISNEYSPYYIRGFKDKGGAPLINGKFVYKRILIRRRQAEER